MPLDPNMPAQELRLHMGELTGNELLVARAAIRWANARAKAEEAVVRYRGSRDVPGFEACVDAEMIEAAGPNK